MPTGDNPRSRLNLKPGGHNRGKPNPNAGRHPAIMREKAQRMLLRPKGLDALATLYDAGQLPAPYFQSLAKIAKFLDDDTNVRFPDGLPPQRVIHLFPPKDAA